MNTNPICILLHLDIFKDAECPSHCKKKNCRFFHSLSERRRPFSKFFYSKLLCPNAETCENIKCRFSHNLTEQIYHPENYKKKYCLNFLKKNSCAYSESCAYAHSDHELKILPLHLLRIDPSFIFFTFKSEFCPFKHQHDRFVCVYAHNWQDYKRPFHENILPAQCPRWNRDAKLETYLDGCPDGFGCTLCHGWKELEYHPALYMKQKCENADCNRKQICGFSHPGQEPFELGNNPFFHVGKAAVKYNRYSLTEYFGLIEVNEADFTPDLFLKGKTTNKSISINVKKQSKHLVFKGNHIIEVESDDEDSFPGDNLMYNQNKMKIRSDNSIKISKMMNQKILSESHIRNPKKKEMLPLHAISMEKESDDEKQKKNEKQTSSTKIPANEDES